MKAFFRPLFHPLALVVWLPYFIAICAMTYGEVI